MLKKNINFDEILKQVITIELSKPQLTSKLIEMFDVSGYSRELNQFWIIREGYFDRIQKIEFQLLSLKDFQILMSKCLMYFTIIIFTLAAFKIGAGFLNYNNIIYGACSFSALMLLIFYLRNARLTTLKSLENEEYKKSLNMLLETLSHEKQTPAELKEQISADFQEKLQ